MPAPELVIADAPYKVYPGGVIAVRCIDFLGTSGATTETDARSLEGTVVRETQQVTNSIFSAGTAAYQEADNTLAIDLVDLPLEKATSDGMRYAVFLSMLIEGDWDSVDEDTSRGSTQGEFAFACRVGCHGFSDSGGAPQADSAPVFPWHLARARPHFYHTFLGSWLLQASDPPDDLFIRAYTHSNATCEFLLDQLVFLPNIVSAGTFVEQWRDDDFQRVGGASGDVQTTPMIDGLDGGGDDNGKFTWHPYQTEEATVDFSGADGGGDYQQDDSEYLLQIIPEEDYYFLWNSQSEAEASAHSYSLHGSDYREAATWISDPFTRADAGTGWDKTPGGFQWAANDPGVVFLNGTQGVLHYTGPTAGHVNLQGSTVFGPQEGARIYAENLSIGGNFIVDEFGGSPFIGGGAGTKSWVMIRLSCASTPTTGYALVVKLAEQKWSLWHFQNTHVGGQDAAWWVVGGWVRISPDFDISSFFAPEPQSVQTGFRFEIRRYLIRARVWEWSAGEPSTWDYEDFRPVAPGGMANPPVSPDSWELYPYGDDPYIAKNAYEPLMPAILIGSQNGAASQWETYWDDIEVTYDPGGTSDSMHALIEQPDGDEVGRIEIPYGAWSFVYWGQRDWTELDAFDDPYLQFSSKVWNDAGAAELQRAEAPFWWFRSVHGGIVSMNWSSALPVDITRVHG